MSGASPLASTSDLGLGPAPPKKLQTAGFDSLQELLEREGYKETRIVTPASKHPVIVSIDDAEDLLDAQDTSTQKQPTIHSWMKGMMAAQVPPEPPKRRSLHASQSDLALRVQIQHRRSAIWDASRAYRNGAPSMSKAPPADPSSSFLAEPAQPVVSRADAVVVRENEPAAPLRSLRRTKSQDLLQKALKSRNSSKHLRPPPPLCTCGRASTQRSTLSWRKTSYSIEPRWHAHDCPVRLSWEMTAAEPVPPAPPKLYVSTPRGIHAPQQLELQGKEFEPRDWQKFELQRLFPRASRPRMGLAKRATIPSLYGVFCGSDPGTDPLRLAPGRSLSRSHPARKQRLPRMMSAPQMRCSPSLTKTRASSVALSAREARMRRRPCEKLTPAEASPRAPSALIQPSMLAKYEAATTPERVPERGASGTPMTSLMDSPTVQRCTNHAAMQKMRSTTALDQQENVPPLLPMPTAPRRPRRMPSTHSKLDVRKPSKTRPVPASEASPRNLAAFASHENSGATRAVARTDVPLRRAQSSRVLKLHRQPSTMTLGLGLALPTIGTPALFVPGTTQPISGRLHSADSAAVPSREHRMPSDVPPVPPIPCAYMPQS